MLGPMPDGRFGAVIGPMPAPLIWRKALGPSLV